MSKSPRQARVVRALVANRLEALAARREAIRSRPITVGCNTCNARPNEPCSMPTTNGRANVRWFHFARTDAAKEA